MAHAQSGKPPTRRLAYTILDTSSFLDRRRRHIRHDAHSESTAGRETATSRQETARRGPRVLPRRCHTSGAVVSTFQALSAGGGPAAAGLSHDSIPRGTVGGGRSGSKSGGR